MTLKRIRLELARNKEYPDGSSRHGYEFRAAICYVIRPGLLRGRYPYGAFACAL